MNIGAVFYMFNLGHVLLSFSPASNFSSPLLTTSLIVISHHDQKTFSILSGSGLIAFNPYTHNLSLSRHRAGQGK